MPLTPSFSTRMLQISPLGQNSVRFKMERSAPLHTPASPSTAPGRHTVPPERSSWQWWYSPITSVITYWAAPLFCGQIMQVLSGWCDSSHWVDSCHDGYKPCVSTTSGLNTAVDGNMWMLTPCHAWMKAAIVTVAVPAKHWGHFLAMVAVFVPRCRKAGSDSTAKNTNEQTKWGTKIFKGRLFICVLCIFVIKMYLDKLLSWQSTYPTVFWSDQLIECFHWQLGYPRNPEVASRNENEAPPKLR